MSSKICNPADCELLKLKSDFGLEIDKPRQLMNYKELWRFYDGIECLELRRNSDGSGVLYFRDVFICDTLENPDTFIKDGVYPLEKTYSSKFKTNLYEITKVKGRSRLLIHQGNYIHNSSGCVLVGVKTDNNLVLSYSTITLRRLMFIIKHCQISFIKIITL